jgi:hypothetical protein
VFVPTFRRNFQRQRLVSTIYLRDRSDRRGARRIFGIGGGSILVGCATPIATAAPSAY